MDPTMHRRETPLGSAPNRPGVRRRASAQSAPGRASLWVLDGRLLAVVLGVLAALGLVGAALSFVVDLFVAPWRILTVDVEESLHLVASAIGLAGAFQLSRGVRRARVVILAGLALNVMATLLFSGPNLGRPETITPLLTWLALAVLTVLSRRADPSAERSPGYPWPPP